MGKNISKMTIDELTEEIRSQGVILKALLIFWVAISIIVCSTDFWLYTTIKTDSMVIITLCGLAVLTYAVLAITTENEKRFKVLEEKVENLERYKK